VLPPLKERFKPEAVVLQCGCDGVPIVNFFFLFIYFLKKKFFFIFSYKAIRGRLST